MKCSGYYVATAGEYKLVKLWDLRTSKTFQILQLDPGYEVIYNTYFNYYQIIGFSWRTSASTPVAPTWLWWGLMWQCTSASSGRSWRWWGSTRLFLPGWDLESMPSTWPPPVWTEPWRSTHLRLLPCQAGEQSPARRPVNTPPTETPLSPVNTGPGTLVTKTVCTALLSITQGFLLGYQPLTAECWHRIVFTFQW